MSKRSKKRDYAKYIKSKMVRLAESTDKEIMEEISSISPSKLTDELFDLFFHEINLRHIHYSPLARTYSRFLTEFQIRQARSSARSSAKMAKIAISVSVLTLVLTLVFSLMDYYGDKVWQKEQLTVLTEIKALISNY